MKRRIQIGSVLVGVLFGLGVLWVWPPPELTHEGAKDVVVAYFVDEERRFPGYGEALAQVPLRTAPGGHCYVGCVHIDLRAKTYEYTMSAGNLKKEFGGRFVYKAGRWQLTPPRLLNGDYIKAAEPHGPGGAKELR